MASRTFSSRKFYKICLILKIQVTGMTGKGYMFRNDCSIVAFQLALSLTATSTSHEGCHGLLRYRLVSARVKFADPYQVDPIMFPRIKLSIK